MEFKLVEQMSFDWMIAVYFFLGGLSAGSYSFSVAANYWKKEFMPLAKTAAIITPVCLAAGLFFLLFDLGQPFRAWRLFTSFTVTSALSWGVWFLNIFFVISALYAFCLIIGQDQKAKKIAYIGLPFALLVATYTAILLAQSPGRALWHSPLLPVLFLVGGLISGISLVFLLSPGKLEAENSTKLGRFIAWMILVELGLIAIKFIVLFNGGPEAVDIAKHIIGGKYAFLFWIVEIVLGAAVPAFFLLRNKLSPLTRTTALVMALIGVFTMRYILVVGGQIPTY